MEPKEVRQRKNSLDDAVAAAAQVFHDAGTDLCDQDLVRRIMTSLILHVGTEQESSLFSRFRGMLVSAGQIIGCDEKLFEYDSASSHMVRVVPGKKQVGLWNYTMCVWLDSKHPFCIYSSCHTEITNLDQHVTMPELITEQIRIARELQPRRGFQSCLVWDSYYLTQLCVQILRAERVPYIAAINPQRFSALCSTIDRFASKVGTWLLQ